jgi:hypothetical protein
MPDQRKALIVGDINLPLGMPYLNCHGFSIRQFVVTELRVLGFTIACDLTVIRPEDYAIAVVLGGNPSDRLKGVEMVREMTRDLPLLVVGQVTGGEIDFLAMLNVNGIIVPPFSQKLFESRVNQTLNI